MDVAKHGINGITISIFKQSRLGGRFAVIQLKIQIFEERSGLTTAASTSVTARRAECVCVCLIPLFICHALNYCLSLISLLSPPSLLSPSQPIIPHMSVLITNSAAGEGAGGETERRFLSGALSQMTAETRKSAQAGAGLAARGASH